MKIIPKNYRNLISVVLIDIFLICFSWCASFLLKFNFDIPVSFLESGGRILPVVILTKLVIFYFFDVYRGMWRYTGLIDLFNIVKGTVLSTLILTFTVLLVHRFQGFSRSIFIIDGLTTILLISGFRVFIRIFYERRSGKKGGKSILHHLFGHRMRPPDSINLVILGAGSAGEKICREIRENARLKYYVEFFLDDDPVKAGKHIHGIPVLGAIEDLPVIAAKRSIHEILIAISSITAKQMRAIIDICEQTGLPFKTLPGLGELIDGKLTVNAIRDVAYRDLLGRAVVELEEDLIGKYLEHSCVMITGAGGSIGAELSRQACRFSPRQVLLFDQAESPLYAIDIELRQRFPYIDIVPILGDIRNRSRLRKIFAYFKPQTVFHAAAYKHVPMLEIQPWEAVLNNIQGSRNLIDTAAEFGARRFVLVSTDKAVRPTNIMGTTKRVVELLAQASACKTDIKTKFITVRFGNVVGSVGSVIPLFKKQIASGGPVTITHPEVTRFFMTIPEAGQLILQAGAMGRGGEIYLLKMGEPVKILDMAKDLIRMSGFEPEKDIEVKYIGLRPGEKLYEELITEGENIVPTDHRKIMVLTGQDCDLDRLNGNIDAVIQAARAHNTPKIVDLLCDIVPEYDPDKKNLTDMY